MKKELLWVNIIFRSIDKTIKQWNISYRYEALCLLIYNSRGYHSISVSYIELEIFHDKRDFSHCQQ